MATSMALILAMARRIPECVAIVQSG